MTNPMKAVPDYNAMSDDTFRCEARAFFEGEYPPHLRNILRRARWGEMKEWWGKLYAKGWAAPRWPREWGGMELNIWTTEAWQRINDMLLETAAEDGVLAGVRDIDGVEADILSSYYYARPGTIVGGSSEIQRNILARYVLRLPT